MDENITTAPEDTTPTEAVTESEVTQDTAATAPQEQKVDEIHDDSAADAQAEKADSAQEVTIPVNFNHESRELSLEDAKKYAQLGLKLEGLQKQGMDIEALKPVISTLDFLAAQSGLNRDDYVKSISEAAEESMRKELMDKFGDDEEIVNEMLELKRSKAKEKYEKMLEDRRKAAENSEEKTKVSLESRLADEFCELKSVFPELTEFKDLPASVKKAASEGKDLTKAYLLHQQSEQKKIAAQQKSEKEAAAASTGSVSSAGESEDNLITAMKRAIRG